MQFRQPATPGRWLPTAALMALLICAAGLAALGLVQRARESARVPLGSVTGRAAAAAGDSGVFALNDGQSSTPPFIARADAESAAVAIAYWFAPTRLAFRKREAVERPAERRHVCAHSYYVRSVVSLPESLPETPVTSSIVSAWGSAWVVPVCDDVGFVRTTALIGDAPTRLRVVLGDQPGDFPELVFPRDRSGHVNTVPQQLLGGFDRGVGLSPEVAVRAVAALLRQTGARITEVAEAFRIVLSQPYSNEKDPVFRNASAAQTSACPRWRMTLDRPVALRGVVSGQIVHSRTVFVARGTNGCDGIPMVQIPRPSQPPTLTYVYGVRPGFRDDSVVPPRAGRPSELPPIVMRSTALPVTAPIWFEAAIVVRDKRGLR